MPSKPTKDDVAAVLGKIEAFPEGHRAFGRRMHELILQTAPELKPRVWYGMPGYAKSASSPVLIFFRVDDYMTFGVTEKANIDFPADDGSTLVASSWYIGEMNAATEKAISDVVKSAVK